MADPKGYVDKKDRKTNKSTDQFKKTMLTYLEDRADNDELFAVSYKKEGKNLDDCINYIMNTVKKAADGSNAIGFSDEEIYSLAVHYYDEDISKDQLKAGNMKVVVNHKVQLTEEEIEEEKEKARKSVFTEQEKAMKTKKKKAKPVIVEESKESEVKPIQNTLF